MFSVKVCGVAARKRTLTSVGCAPTVDSICMIMFKILLVILLAAPVIGLAALLYVRARNYSAKQNRESRETKTFVGRR